MEKNNTQVLEGDQLIHDFFNDVKQEPEKEEVPVVDVNKFFDEESTPVKEENTDTEPQKKQENTTDTTIDPQVGFYTSLVKELILDGSWEDISIELEEGQEPVSISQFEEITPDLFKQLWNTQQAAKDQKLQEEYISVKGLDETTRKMIELKKSGGDIKELLHVEAEIVHPLKGYDLENEAVQEWLIRQKYTALGWKPKHIDDEIKELRENLQLDIEAKKIIEEVDKNFDTKVSEKLKAQEEQNRLFQEEQKQFRKKMTEEFRGFEIKKDTLITSLVNASTKTDENGLTEAEKAFFELKEKDPKHFAEVVFLMMNKEGYNEFKGVKIKNQVNIDNAKKVFKLAPKASAAAIKQSTDKTNVVEEFFK
jgi:hypothetical protein